jgi:hypothetical protein
MHHYTEAVKRRCHFTEKNKRHQSTEAKNKHINQKDLYKKNFLYWSLQVTDKNAALLSE